MMNSSPTLPSDLPLAKNSLTNSNENAVTIKLQGSDRWFIVGKTGVGKTILAKWLLNKKAKKKKIVIVADHLWRGKDKQGLAIPFIAKGPGTVDSPRVVKRFDKNLHVQIYLPTMPGWTDQGLQKLYADVMKHGNVVIYIDELYKVIDSSHIQSSPRFLLLWTEGRKYGVEAWGGAQKPTYIPDIVMSQAENWAVFRVINDDDLKKISKMTDTPDIRDHRIPKYFWWFWNQEMDHAKLMKPIDTKKGGTHAH